MSKRAPLLLIALLLIQSNLFGETANSPANPEVRIDIKIDSVLVLSGESSVKIPIYFSNYLDTIAGFTIWIQLTRPDIALFNKTGGPLFRIDTSGSLLSDWEFMDTRSLAGQELEVKITGIANFIPPLDTIMSPIYPQTNGLLLTLVLDVFDVPDILSDRVVDLHIFKDFASLFNFADLHGNSILVTEAALNPSLFTTQDGALTVNCCYNPGDFTHDGNIDIKDLTASVNYMFKSGNSPLCTNDADINGVCGVNISDLTFRVNWMFKSGQDPVCGCTK